VSSTCRCRRKQNDLDKATICSLTRLEGAACSVSGFVSLLVREEVLLVGLCEKKIPF